MNIVLFLQEIEDERNETTHRCWTYAG